VNGKEAFRLAAVRVIAAVPLALFLPQVRYMLESRMLLHMTLELPLLLLSGVAAASMIGERSRLGHFYDSFDVHGLLGAALVASLSLFWMLPVSLDLSLIDTPLRLVKYASWWVAGLALKRTWPRLADESLVFFVGNMSWMLATAGLLYQASDSRLCVNYLLDDQLIAGRALVVAAVMLGIWAVVRLARPRAATPVGSQHQL
jgi:hypothetical protein